MAFPKYEIYKDSGIEWLGKIPSHWNLARLKTAIKSSTNGIWGSDPDENNEDDGIVCIRVADFSRHNLLVSLEKLTRRKISDSEFQSRKLLPGDLLLEKSGGGDNQLVGQVVLFEHDIPAVCSNFLARLRIRDNFSSRFLNYVNACLYFLKINYKHIKQTTGIQNIDSNSYFSEFFAFPTLEEQQRIADFLDRKTSEIDQAIAQKQRLIELLQEQKAILINQAVTKGINPNVLMRDSGIEWLGKIPEHWEIKRLKFLVPKIEGGVSPLCYDFPPLPGKWGVLKSGCVNGGEFNEQESKTLPPYIKPNLQIEVQKGDILMSRASGSIDLIGSVAIVKEKPSSRLMLSDKTFRLSIDKKVCDASFFAYYMQSFSGREQIKNFVSGAGGLANNIPISSIREIICILPRLDEQNRICIYLAEQTELIERSLKSIVNQIKNLNELKQILISQAVTGKMKV